MIINGAQIVSRVLLEQNTDTVFGYPGGNVVDIYDALYEVRDKIRHIITAHEQGAAHAADGYARATGKTGVVIATSGPGATNLVTGIATAYLDSVPIVAVTGNVSCEFLGRDSFQEVDIVGITIPVTKHNYIVKDVTTLADTLREAFWVAQSGRPGPVLVDITKDVQQAMCDYEPKPPVLPKKIQAPSGDVLKKALSAIKKAKRPYIYFGGGIISGGAEKELAVFAEKTDAVLGCSLMGLSAVPNSNPRFLGMQGLHGRYASSAALEESDLIVAAGVRFSDRATGNDKKYAENKTVIHIDTDAAEINKNVKSAIGIVGDVKTTLRYFADNLEQTKRDEWQKRAAALKEKEKELTAKSARMTPYDVIDAVNKYMPEDAIVVTDVGQHQMWAAQRAVLRDARTFLSSGGLGTMGYGLGAAVGAAVGTAKRPVLYTGDGCFGMNMNELVTVSGNNIPIVIIMMNNGVLGMVRQVQNEFYGKRYAYTTLNRNIDYEKLMEAFGAKAYNITKKDELESTVKEAFGQDKPVLLNCIIDKDEMVFPIASAGFGK